MGKDVRKFGTSDKRGRAATNPDPYFPEAVLKENSLCSRCHAIYRNKRWFLDGSAFEEAKNQEGTHWITCPACRKIAEHYIEGVVTLRGSYLWKHEGEIRNILNNEGAKALAKNPMERIVRMERNDDGLVIETTETKLAEHLGRVLHRAHHGELQVTWADNPAVCRVSWERME